MISLPLSGRGLFFFLSFFIYSPTPPTPPLPRFSSLILTSGSATSLGPARPPATTGGPPRAPVWSLQTGGPRSGGGKNQQKKKKREHCSPGRRVGGGPSPEGPAAPLLRGGEPRGPHPPRRGFLGTAAVPVPPPAQASDASDAAPPAAPLSPPLRSPSCGGRRKEQQPAARCPGVEALDGFSAASNLFRGVSSGW